MKLLIITLSLIFTSLTYSQTKLIKHKSHSGINATFKPHNIEGNFGLFPIKNEIAKDEKSSYKLIETRNINEAKNGKSLILFKTKNKALKKTMCMNDDEVIANIHTEDDNLFEEIKILLTKKLEKLRSEEK